MSKTTFIFSPLFRKLIPYRRWTPYHRDLPKRRPTAEQKLLGLIPGSGMRMRTLRRRYGDRDFNQVLRNAVKRGSLEIQQNGFAADNLNHHKLVVVREVSAVKRARSTRKVHPAGEAV